MHDKRLFSKKMVSAIAITLATGTLFLSGCGGKNTEGAAAAPEITGINDLVGKISEDTPSQCNVTIDIQTKFAFGQFERDVPFSIESNETSAGAVKHTTARIAAAPPDVAVNEQYETYTEKVGNITTIYSYTKSYASNDQEWRVASTADENKPFSYLCDLGNWEDPTLDIHSFSDESPTYTLTGTIDEATSSMILYEYLGGRGDLILCDYYVWVWGSPGTASVTACTSMASTALSIWRTGQR